MSIATSPDLLWLLGRHESGLADRGEAACQLNAALRSGTTPAAVVTHLANHGLVPLAYRHLVARRDVDLADALASELAAEFRRHALTRFRYTRRLRELLTILESAGIEAIPYKGPALAIQLFGNYAMRQFGDLDILVRRADALRAQEVLLDSGLTRHRKATTGWEEYLHRVRHSIELRDAREQVVIELHWSLADRFLGMNLDGDWLFQDTGQIDLLGRPTRVMGAAQLLIALGLHGAKHLWERGVWLAEVAEIVRRHPDLDWEAIFARADRSGFGRALRACLILTRDLLQAAPPERWSHALDSDPGACRLASALAGRITGTPHDRLRSQFRLGYMAQSTALERLRFCWRVATDLSERDIGTLKRPPRFPLAHGLRRSLRLARTHRRETRPI